MKPLLLPLSLLLLVLTPGLRAQPLITVTGVVRHALTAAPLPRIVVSLERRGAPASEQAVTTTADGHFSFQVPPGTYQLMAQSTLYGGQFYGAPDFQTGPAQALVLSADSPLPPLDFRILPPATISGFVRDAHGQPVEAAILHLYQARLVGGRRRVVARGTVYSDDLGHYRFTNLGPGEYFLAASGTPWHSREGIAWPGTAHYAVQFYPGVATLARAGVLALTVGQQARADFRLAEGVGPAVEVGVAPFSAGASLRLLIQGAGPAGRPRLQQTVSVTGPRQTLAPLPPGEYEAVVRGTVRGKPVYGATRFTLRSEAVTVSVPVAPLPALSGRLECTSPSRPSLAFSDPDQSAYVPVVVGPGGAFTSPPLTPGRYMVTLGDESPCYVHRLTRNGRPVPGDRITVGADSITNLVVETKPDAGSLHGVVSGGTGKVYLAPATPAEPGPYREVLAGSDGSFDFPRLPPGRYALFVVPTAPPLFEYANREAIAPFLRQATVLDVPAGQRVRRDLRP
jgi:hypothetical protein